MGKKKISDTEEIKKIHSFFWKSIWGLTIKLGAITSAIIIGMVEFTRKVKLYDLGVPLFVLDAEPLITSYSYGKTIILSLILLPCLWLFLWSMEHFMLYKSLWKKFLFAILFLIGSSFFLISFYFLLWYVPPSGETIYATKDYIVTKSENGTVTVSAENGKFTCKKQQAFSDECNIMEGK